MTQPEWTSDAPKQCEEGYLETSPDLLGREDEGGKQGAEDESNAGMALPDDSEKRRAKQRQEEANGEIGKLACDRIVKARLEHTVVDHHEKDGAQRQRREEFRQTKAVHAFVCPPILDWRKPV